MENQEVELQKENQEIEHQKENIYKHSKIYKIVSYAGDKLCIGSTNQKLSMRMCGLRSLYRKGIGKPTSAKKLFDLYGANACKIILIEKYECETKEELNQRERYHIDNFEDKDKLIDEKEPKLQLSDTEAIKAYNKQYYLNNKDHIRAQTKKYKDSHKAERRIANAKKIAKMKGIEYIEPKPKETDKELLSLIKALELKLLSMT